MAAAVELPADHLESNSAKSGICFSSAGPGADYTEQADSFLTTPVAVSLPLPCSGKTCLFQRVCPFSRLLKTLKAVAAVQAPSHRNPPMLRNFSVVLVALTFSSSLAASAQACCLLPFLNPFSWTCGYGYGCQNYNPCCAPGWSGGYPGGYRSYGRSIYTPSYSPGFPGADCNCNSGVPTSTVPASPAATDASAWMTPTNGWSAPMTAWSGYPAWRPQRHWQSAMAPGWNTMPQAPMPQTAMSTAPIYGPTYEIPTPTRYQTAQATGDIYGDHEIPVTPNSYQSATPAPIHRVNYRRPMGYQPLYPRPARRYFNVVR